MSPEKREKLIWVEKLDTILSAITSAWDKTIVITGDTNIDYIKPSVAFTQYKVILQTYNLKQHITIPARKNTYTIYYLIVNLPENEVITSNVLPYAIVSDHDAPHIIAKIPG